ncbi:PhzF family phenazine biosynthesis isomerase [Alkalibaculum sp. M08DMB]|uniref:PhzF family phenazine biosynthesis isomerase n=1 Tax=Alkalibaculum sporogenes TaxID=2655001 RepID=A0A6A7K7V0_9FIRM|nr:PhzF family phenazine biosynthesis isomerase [Alkalibaculum sporogenes]MPW25475.1 PhzF family phenazine biosynthesis isomerase [Alkalibaculum sporogenes]
MREYNYKKIDAFISGKSLGNPAACIYLENSKTLSHDEMLTIAKQHKGFVSEVVYCSNSQQSGLNLIYYSSECEVDFCGHGTIACMYSLIKSSSTLLEKSEIIINTNKKGTLTVYNKIPEQDAVFITAPEPTFFELKISIEEIADSLEVDTDKILSRYPIDLINAGLTTLIIPIVDLSCLINVLPNEQNLKKFCFDNEIDIILIFSTEVNDNKNIAHTRVFAPKFGYLEDPATGSGNSAFGYYMLKNSIWKGEDVSIEQGGSDIEYNIVKLAIQNHKIIFGGAGTDRIIGKYYL